MKDEHMHSMILDWIESKDFSDLDLDEKSQVTSVMTEEDYRFHREIVLSAARSPQTELVRPLVLPKKTRPLPFVITAVSSAAAAVFVLLFFRSESLPEVRVQWKTPVASVDTVYVRETSVDTVIEYIYAQTKKPEIYQASASLKTVPELIVTDGPVVSLRSKDLVNVGVTAENDRSEEQFRPKHFIGM